LGTARVNDLAACFGGHTRPKAVTAFANEVAGLKGAFHALSPCCVELPRIREVNSISSPLITGVSGASQTPWPVKSTEVQHFPPSGVFECFNTGSQTPIHHETAHPRSSARDRAIFAASDRPVKG
jgi:hypothetical protein